MIFPWPAAIWPGVLDGELPALVQSITPHARAERERRRSVWIETGFVLLACVVPLVFVSVASGPQPDRPREGFLFQSVYRILQATVTIAIILFVISKSAQSRRRFGLFRLRKRDILNGVGIYLLSIAVYYAFWIGVGFLMSLLGIRRLGGPALGALASPMTELDYLVLVVLSLVNGAAEELVMRAYLVTRFEQLLGSTSLAVVLSAALFAAYHSYQGYVGLISVAIVGLLYGLCFARWRRIWPLIFAHALQDFVSIALLASRR